MQKSPAQLRQIRERNLMQEEANARDIDVVRARQAQRTVERRRTEQRVAEAQADKIDAVRGQQAQQNAQRQQQAQVAAQSEALALHKRDEAANFGSAPTEQPLTLVGLPDIADFFNGEDALDFLGETVRGKLNDFFRFIKGSDPEPDRSLLTQIADLFDPPGEHPFEHFPHNILLATVASFFMDVREWAWVAGDERGGDEEVSYFQPAIPNLELVENPTNWSDYEDLVALAPLALAFAREWNPEDSPLSDDAFAAIMLANLHEEARLRRRNLSQEPLQIGGAFVDAIGDVLAIGRGSNSSVGIANMRASEVEEIVNEQIPLDDQSTIYFPVEGRLDEILSAFGGLDVNLMLGIDRVALEFLAADTARGILRAQYYGVEPTVFNISTWLTKGRQGHPGSTLPYGDPNSNEDEQAIDHANRVLRAFEAIIQADTSMFGLTVLPSDYDYANVFDEDYLSDENRLIFGINQES
jgi:hypothetical protein